MEVGLEGGGEAEGLRLLLEVLLAAEMEGFGVSGGEETAVGQESVSVGLCVSLL